MNKKIIFLLIAGIAVIIILVSLVNAAKRRQIQESDLLRPPAKLEQGLSVNTPTTTEKTNAGAKQEEPEAEPPLKAGEQLLN